MKQQAGNLAVTASGEASTSPHTPGPWTVEHSGTGQYLYEVTAASPRGKRVVVARISGGPNNRRGNAFMVAATTDLLDVVRALVWCVDNGRGLNPIDENSPLIDAARTALTKAIGASVGGQCSVAEVATAELTEPIRGQVEA